LGSGISDLDTAVGVMLLYCVSHISAEPNDKTLMNYYDTCTIIIM